MIVYFSGALLQQFGGGGGFSFMALLDVNRSSDSERPPVNNPLLSLSLLVAGSLNCQIRIESIEIVYIYD